MDNKNKKSVTFSIISLVVVAGLVLLLGTYAYWQITRKQNDRNLIGSACLDISFSNETGDIYITNMWPTSDSDGAELTPYTFRITNNCSNTVSYIIALESLADEDSESPQYLNYNNIKIKLDSDGPVKFGSLETLTNDTNEDYTIRDTKQLGMGSLPGNGHADHSIRIWLDANTPIEEINKIFLSKVKIIAGQGIESDECYAIKSDGTITEYNPTCGTSVTIPATINGIRVRSIATDAFKTLNATYSVTLAGIEGDVGRQSDFSIVLANKFLPLLSGEASQEQMMAILSTATADDIWIVINHPELSAEKEAVLDDAIVAAFTELNAIDMLAVANLQPSDFAIYKKGVDTLPSGTNGAAEFVFEMTNPTSEVGANLMGQRVPSSFSTDLTINSLDLSQATYLERIEERAFSNLPAWNNDILNQLENIETGLTSLTFGNNTNAIHIGAGAFAGMDLDSLTIYNSLEYATIDSDGEIAFVGPFSNSTIDSLTVAKAGDNSTYVGIGMRNYNTIASVEAGNLGEGIGQSLTAILALALPQANVQNVTFANGITLISSSDFTITNTLTLPNDLQELGPLALMGYTGSSLSLPSTLTVIGNYAFGNYNGNSLTIPSGVVTIGEYAFQNYNGNNFTIPSSVTTIGQHAFSAMDSTKTIMVNRAETGMTLGTNWNGEATVNYSS